MDDWEYGIFRESGMYMDGPHYVRVIAATFPTYEHAKTATNRIPYLPGHPLVIRRRRAGQWETVED